MIAWSKIFNSVVRWETDVNWAGRKSSNLIFFVRFSVDEIFNFSFANLIRSCLLSKEGDPFLAVSWQNSMNSVEESCWSWTWWSDQKREGSFTFLLGQKTMSLWVCVWSCCTSPKVPGGECATTAKDYVMKFSDVNLSPFIACFSKFYGCIFPHTPTLSHTK